MIDIVDRLRFDATRCELQFSKGIASNIEEAAARIEALEAALRNLIHDIDMSNTPTSVNRARAALDPASQSYAGHSKDA